MTIPIIPVDMKDRPIHTCVYVEEFRFRVCEIKTCKNWSSVTNTKCLAIDRVQPVGNKIISDAELHLYKYSAENVSTRLISLKRKRAITRVQTLIVLNTYIEFIQETCRPRRGKVYDTELMRELESVYPLRIKRLQFKNWMWPHLASKKVWKKFVELKGGQCGSIRPHMMLNISREQFGILLIQLKEKRE